MRFSVNVSILFTDVPLLERFARAREAGFDAVELWWPSGEDPEAVRAAIEDAGVEVVLINFDAGDMPGGDRGLISDPERQEGVPGQCSGRPRAGRRRGLHEAQCARRPRTARPGA